MRTLEDRHQSTREKMRWLTPNPNLPSGLPADVAETLYETGVNLVSVLDDGPQLTIGLQHLIDAKDAMVRQALTDTDGS